jgi:hypothetical protein
MPDLGEIVRALGDEYLVARATTPFQRKALSSIGRCRTPAMGAVVKQCEQCGSEYPLFRSCRNRHCPLCQAEAREAWLEARKEELLPVPYFHVVFTVPEDLNPIALYCPEVFYAALLRAAGNAILDVGRAKLHAQLGCLTILHTWGQNLSLHPHVHCVVPGGGLSSDGQRWISLRNAEYLLPVEVLWRRFRSLLSEALRTAARNGELERLPRNVPPHLTIEGAAAQQWIAYVKPPFGGPEHVLEYLSRYTHRVAISNQRILSFSDHKVTFRWRDYSDGNRVKVSTIDGLEFLRRFLLHVLPDRFVRIRYFGFMANGKRKHTIAFVRTLIKRVVARSSTGRSSVRFLCPACWANVDRSRSSVTDDRDVRPPPVTTCAA